MAQRKHHHWDDYHRIGTHTHELRCTKCLLERRYVEDGGRRGGMCTEYRMDGMWQRLKAVPACLPAPVAERSMHAHRSG